MKNDRKDFMQAEKFISDTSYNPHLPCELQGGHDWIKVAGKNVNEVSLTLEVCQRA